MSTERDILADIRRRNEERKASEASGIIGGAREGFDVDFLLRYIDSADAPVEAEPVRNELFNRCYDFFGQYGDEFEHLDDEDAERYVGEFVDGLLDVVAGRKPACTCTNICPEDRTENDCKFCKGLDIYDPCPVVGFGCGTCGDVDDPCCTPEQQKAANS